MRQILPHQYPFFIKEIREKTGFTIAESYELAKVISACGVKIDELALRRFLKSKQLMSDKQTIGEIESAMQKAELLVRARGH